MPTASDPGRATSDPGTLSGVRNDRGSLGPFGTKRRKIQTDAVEQDTYCSLCQRMHIVRGVRIWIGARRLRPTQTYYIICLDCARTIGKAAK